MRRILLLTLILQLSCTSISKSRSPAGLGPGSGGGGNSAVETRSGAVHFLDLIRLPGTVVYDYLHEPAYKVLLDHLNQHDGYEEATYFPSYPDNLHMQTSSIKEKILWALSRLTFYVTRSGAALPDPHDMGIVVLPLDFDGKPQRFAYQDIDSVKVIFDGHLFDKMSDLDVAAFLEHEALIRLWYDDPINVGSHVWDKEYPKNKRLASTGKIGDIVHMTFSPDPAAKNVSAKALSVKMCEAGIRVAPQQISGLKYMPSLRMKNDVELPIDDKLSVDKFFIFNTDVCVVRTFEENGRWEEVKMAGHLTGYNLNLFELANGQKYNARYWQDNIPNGGHVLESENPADWDARIESHTRDFVDRHGQKHSSFEHIDSIWIKLLNAK